MSKKFGLLHLLLTSTFIGCGTLEATFETQDASSGQNKDNSATGKDTPTQDVSDEPVMEDLSVTHIWTADELAKFPIGTKGIVRTVLHGFDLVDLPVALAGHANIVPNSTTPFHLFHGIAGASEENPWSKWGGAAAGMSGSPIIIEGRVASALSYGLSLPEHTEPFQFGATPAHLMAELTGEQAAFKPSQTENSSDMRSLGLIALSGGERYIHLFEKSLTRRGFT